MTITMSPANKTLSLIADLLARAEGGTTQAERDLALQRAQREAVRHGIDLAEAAYANLKRGKPMEPEERKISIGDPGTKGLRVLTDFFIWIAGTYGCESLISRNGTTVWLHGMPEDIDMTETMYASLLVQMRVACEEWLATGEYLGDFDPNNRRQVWSDRAYGYVSERAPDKGVARRSFNRGFTNRILSLLRREKWRAQDEAEREAEARGDMGTDEHGAVTTTALALREKSKAVTTFHEQIIKEQKIRSSWRGDRGGRTNWDAVDAGAAAAERANRSKRGTRGIGA